VDLRRETGDAYRVDCFEANAVNYGAPQLRERALFVGNRLDRVVTFPPPAHGSDDTEQGKLFRALKPYRTLRDAIGELHEDNPVLLDFSPRKKKYLAMVPPGGNWRSLPPKLQKESMGQAWYAKGGRSGWWRRLSWDLPSPTVVTMPNHASTSMCHPVEVRVLSLAECAAVQEFPPDWEFAGTVLEQYEQVGNAVPPRLGVVAGDVIARQLDATRAKKVKANGKGELWDKAQAVFAPAFRKVYVKSHVRTRQWFKAGTVFVWDQDGGDNRHARYSAVGRAQRGRKPPLP